MIPKEGRISHLSFEPNKKQSAKRYYDLRTTVIDSMQDFTNIIAIASQPPAWFFSPKELHMPLMECLQKVNFCDNSFIQESFVVNPDTAKIDLLHHEFIKHRTTRNGFLSYRPWSRAVFSFEIHPLRA